MTLDPSLREPLVAAIPKLIRFIPKTHLRDDCNVWAIRRCCCRKQGQWPHNKEMCHEEIHRCSRVDLTDRDPVAHPDCKCSPRVAVELLIREQRLLTTSRARERFLCGGGSTRRSSCNHEEAGVDMRTRQLQAELGTSAAVLPESR
jgi:hypothetical protein